jgi:DNA-binding GntR family transcriptional regulator
LPDSFQLRGAQAGNWQNGIVAFRLLRHQTPLTLSLAEQLAARIGDRIVGDLYKPGARIIEQELADEFEVSRGPVRDALRILEREGLVAIHARRGAQVTELSEQEVTEVFEVRAALLRIVSEQLAADRSPAYVAHLVEGIAELERHAANPNGSADYAETTYRLGLKAVGLVGNRTLADILTSLALRTLRYTRLGLEAPERRRQSLALWRKALQAIRAGDVKRAGDLVVERVERSRDAVLKQIRSAGGKAAAPVSGPRDPSRRSAAR